MKDKRQDGKDKEAQGNLWQEILREAMTKKEIEDANLFIFGDKKTGKKALITLMAKQIATKKPDDKKKLLTIDEESSKFGLVDYTFLPVTNLNEADSESIGEMGVWVANDSVQDEQFKELFDKIIKPKDILKCVCIIVVDLTERWNIMKSLNKWTKYIYELFSKLLQKFNYDKQTQLKNNLANYCKLYEEPELDEEGNLKKEILTDDAKQIKLESPLKEGLLSSNCGVPIVFVVNKSDAVSDGEDKFLIDQQSDFILKHIRKLAIDFGASIIYTSGRQNINIELLYNYICHRMFDFPFLSKANLIEKDSYFIPTGYDSLAILRDADSAGDLQKFFEDEVKEEKKSKEKKEETEIECEDTNLFLKNLKNEVGGGHQKMPSNVGGEKRPMPNPSDKFKKLAEKTNLANRPGQNVTPGETPAVSY